MGSSYCTCDTRQNDLGSGWRRREVLYLQLSDKPKRRMHVKADGPCNGSIEQNFIVAEVHLYISERMCTYVCRGMLVRIQSNLVANYSNSHHPRPNSKMWVCFAAQTNQKLVSSNGLTRQLDAPLDAGRAGGQAESNAMPFLGWKHRYQVSVVVSRWNGNSSEIRAQETTE